ncbi:hypothetical protein CRYUN_Cryun27aG0001400 [Craigia yunnanensis]
MKPWHIIFLCLLTAAFYLFFSSSISLAGSRSLKMSLPHHKNRYPEAKVVDDGWQSSGKGSMGMGLKYSRSKEKMDEDEDDVNYHIDYHGVTTHPTPTPKHPKP